MGKRGGGPLRVCSDGDAPLAAQLLPRHGRKSQVFGIHGQLAYVVLSKTSNQDSSSRLQRQVGRADSHCLLHVLLGIGLAGSPGEGSPAAVGSHRADRIVRGIVGGIVVAVARSNPCWHLACSPAAGLAMSVAGPEDRHRQEVGRTLLPL